MRSDMVDYGNDGTMMGGNLPDMTPNYNPNTWEDGYNEGYDHVSVQYVEEDNMTHNQEFEPHQLWQPQQYIVPTHMGMKHAFHSHNFEELQKYLSYSDSWLLGLQPLLAGEHSHEYEHFFTKFANYGIMNDQLRRQADDAEVNIQASRYQGDLVAEYQNQLYNIQEAQHDLLDEVLDFFYETCCEAQQDSNSFTSFEATTALNVSSQMRCALFQEHTDIVSLIPQFDPLDPPTGPYPKLSVRDNCAPMLLHRVFGLCWEVMDEMFLLIFNEKRAVVYQNFGVKL